MYEEPEAHDIDRLPHMHEDIEIEKFFPLIKAAPPLINDEEWQPEVEEPEDKVKRVDGLPGRAVWARGKNRGRKRAGKPAGKGEPASPQ